MNGWSCPLNEWLPSFITPKWPEPPKWFRVKVSAWVTISHHRELNEWGAMEKWMNLCILLLESPCSSVRPSVTEKDRIVLANEYTMRTSSPMYDAVKMMMMLIIYVRCDHHHDDYHHHLCTMRSSSWCAMHPCYGVSLWWMGPCDEGP